MKSLSDFKCPTCSTNFDRDQAIEWYNKLKAYNDKRAETSATLDSNFEKRVELQRLELDLEHFIFIDTVQKGIQPDAMIAQLAAIES